MKTETDDGFDLVAIKYFTQKRKCQKQTNDYIVRSKSTEQYWDRLQ